MRTAGFRKAARWMLPAVCALLAVAAWSEEPRTTFKVKYIADGAVYIDGGRASGLTKGMHLQIRTADTSVSAELEVASVTETSAVCDVLKTNTDVKRGDEAVLVDESVALLVRERSVGTQRVYPQVISFDPGEDPIEEEVRAAVPRPPSPEVNRARGRIGVDHTSVIGRGGAPTSRQTGMVLRTDITRIGGTYWNLHGYWRGRLNSRSAPQQETLTDLQNRAYHLALTYENPTSRLVAGFGRLNLPWAGSLDTIDGGYFGWRIGGKVTTGIFAGSTPDPTSWSYDPQRQIAGTFVNFEKGSFESVRYSGTYGMAYEARQWKVERPLVFFENAIFFKHVFSIYHTLQADQPLSPVTGTRQQPGVSRSYLTLRAQPHKRIVFDVNHNYFRDVPTFDPRLIGTGAVDKLLFEGISGGTRIELPMRFAVYGSLGRSNRTGDTQHSWNRMYGAAWNRVPWARVNADVRFSTFSSSFGSGSYRSVSISRDFDDRLRLEVQAGQQRYTSQFTSDSGSRFVTATVDTSLGSRFFLMGGFTAYRGSMQQYDQFSTTIGYRFDSRANRHVD